MASAWRAAVTALVVAIMACDASAVTAARPGGPPRHPRLFFSAADLNSLRARAATSHSELWAQLERYCEEHISDSPPS